MAAALANGDVRWAGPAVAIGYGGVELSRRAVLPGPPPAARANPGAPLPGPRGAALPFVSTS